MLLIIKRKMSWGKWCILCCFLLHETMKMMLQNAHFNAVGVTFLIAQGCQTIVQTTLG